MKKPHLKTRNTTYKMLNKFIPSVKNHDNYKSYLKGVWNLYYSEDMEINPNSEAFWQLYSLKLINSYDGIRRGKYFLTELGFNIVKKAIKNDTIYFEVPNSIGNLRRRNKCDCGNLKVFTSKRCRKCHTTLLHSGIWKRKAKKQTKEERSKQQKKYYLENREVILKKVRAYNKNRTERGYNQK